jgi:hypothetical protein
VVQPPKTKQNQIKKKPYSCKQRESFYGVAFAARLSPLDPTRQDGAVGWCVAFGWSSEGHPSTIVAVQRET